MVIDGNLVEKNVVIDGLIVSGCVVVIAGDLFQAALLLMETCFRKCCY